MTKRHVSIKTLNRYKASLLALNGKTDEALKLIEKDLSRYPADSKERIVSKIKAFGAR